MKSYSSDYRFDWYPKIPTETFLVLSNKLTKSLDECRSARGQSPERLETTKNKERATIDQILIALYQAYYVFPVGMGRVSVPMTSGHYLSSSNDIGKISTYSYTFVKRVIGALEDKGWIKKKKGSEAKGEVTRIWASGFLVKTFKVIGLRWFPQTPNPPKDLVVLRNYKNPEGQTRGEKGPKVNLPVPVSRSVDRFRSSLYQYNQFLTQHCIALDLNDDHMKLLGKVMTKRAEEDEEDWWTEKDQRMNHIDLSRIQLRRIFSRGSMKKGGRFYGGWWQSLPSDYRPHITIDGLKTCEVDYSSMSLRIIYAERGIEIPVEDDLYDIGLPDWQGTSDPRRKPIKTFINAILNDESGRYRLSEEKQELIGIRHEELMRRVSERHEAIADQFNTGIGLYTQFVDSQIAERVIHKMKDEGILVLPIHDSFIVRAGYEQWISVVMEEAFHEVTGGRAGVEADGPRLKKHFGMSKEELNEELRQLEEDPSYGIVNLGDLDLDELLKMDSTLMVKYVGPWEAWRRDQA